MRSLILKCVYDSYQLDKDTATFPNTNSYKKSHARFNNAHAFGDSSRARCSVRMHACASVRVWLLVYHWLCASTGSQERTAQHMLLKIRIATCVEKISFCPFDPHLWLKETRRQTYSELTVPVCAECVNNAVIGAMHGWGNVIFTAGTIHLVFCVHQTIDYERLYYYANCTARGSS